MIECDSVTDTGAGRYLVTTVTGSRYLLDLDARTMRRSPSEIFRAAHALRRDDEDVQILELIQCTVGKPMRLRFNLAVPNVYMTTRITSTVLTIKELPTDFEWR